MKTKKTTHFLALLLSVLFINQLEAKTTNQKLLPPTNIRVSNVTSYSASLTWKASASNKKHTRYRIYSGKTIIGETSNTHYLATGLTPKTYTKLSVQARAYDYSSSVPRAISSPLNSVYITTKDDIYCKPKVTVHGSILSRSTQIGNTYHEWRNWTGHGYFLNEEFTVTRGQEETITLKSGSDHNHYWSVWIDLNKDGVFSSNERLVAEKAKRKRIRLGFVTIYRVENKVTVKIPSAAKLGKTRIRIASTYRQSSSACDRNLGGFMRDYTLNIKGASRVANQTAKTSTKKISPPTNLSLSNTTSHSVSIKWTASSNKEEIRGYRIYNGDKFIGETKDTQFIANGLKPSTYTKLGVEAWGYDFSSKFLKRVTSERVAKYTTTLEDNYCIPNVILSGSVFGRSVTLNNHTHYWKHWLGHRYFLNETFSVKRGQEETITLKSSRDYNHYWSVWVDLNQDGVFSSDEKLVAEKAKLKRIRVGFRFIYRVENNATFKIPSSAKLGKTRIRIASSYKENSSACDKNFIGFMRDYTLNIHEGHNATKEFSVTAYPIPANNTLRIKPNQPLTKNAQYTILNSSGNTFKNNYLKNNEIDVQDLKTGVYFLKINDGTRITTKRFIKK